MGGDPRPINKPDWACEGSLDWARRGAIVAALQHCNQNVTSAAKRLKIGRSTLYRLLDTFEIELPHAYPEAPPAAMRTGEGAKLESRPLSRGKLVEIAGELYIVR